MQWSVGTCWNEHVNVFMIRTISGLYFRHILCMTHLHSVHNPRPVLLTLDKRRAV